MPVKIKKTKIKHRNFNYLCIEYNGNFLMKKRTQKDIWKNLYDFPLIEGDRIPQENDIDYKKLLNSILENEIIAEKTKHYKHQLSHQKLHITIKYIKTKKLYNDNDFLKVNRRQVKELPFPKPIERFFEELFN